MTRARRNRKGAKKTENPARPPARPDRPIGPEGNTCGCDLDNCVHQPMTQEVFVRIYDDLHDAYVRSFDMMTKSGEKKEVVEGVISLYYRAIDNHFMKYYGRHFDGVFVGF